MSLHYEEINAYKVLFFITHSNTSDRINVSEWSSLKEDYASELAILEEWYDNGVARVYQENSLQVPIEPVLRLPKQDQQILGLPTQYPYYLYIRANGLLHENTFEFKIEFKKSISLGDGENLLAQRKFFTLTIGGILYSLSRTQWLILYEVDKFNTLSAEDKVFEKTLTALKALKNLAFKQDSIQFDSYLENEDVFIPNSIQIKPILENGELTLEPIPVYKDTTQKNEYDTLEESESIDVLTLDTEEQTKFVKDFDIDSKNIKPIYKTQNKDGKRTRVLVPETMKESLSFLKKTPKRKITKANEIQEILESPETIFDGSVIDLENYSQRVTGIGEYKPKFYAFVSFYKSEWLPGFALQNAKTKEHAKISFKTEKELEAFETEKNRQASKGESTFVWKDQPIPINKEVDDFIEDAREQLKNPKKKIIKKTEVLLIEENIEELEYSESINKYKDVEHNLYPISNLKATIHLKQHQQEGVAWLQNLYKEEHGAALLADDMGLGKTLQILYFIEWHAQQYPNSTKPYLIVAPVSLLENWQQEYAKFFSPQSLPLKKVYGDGISLYKTEQEIGKYKNSIIEEYTKQHILLTTYETLTSYQLSLGLLEYAIVVLDEAQYIKTPGTKRTNASKSLKADFKLAMTGTPVENTYIDLWCIVDFIKPSLLGNLKEFTQIYQNPLKKENVNVAEIGERLRNNIGHFLKRRLKIDVAKDLPQKIDDESSKIRKEMPSEQFEFYNRAIVYQQEQIATAEAKANMMLMYIHKIRNISDHPYLDTYNLQEIECDRLIKVSAKLQVTIELLETIQRKQEKVIIFTERKEIQKMIQRVLKEKFKITAKIINGDTPSTQANPNEENEMKQSRQKAIDIFTTKEGFNAIIMSPIAAGVGLNVTAANHVIHYSRHWNPAKESQATDRAYRIGQEKDVYVYYPMAIFPKHIQNGLSFDETIDRLLSRKQSLATASLYPSEQVELKVSDLYSQLIDTKSTTPISEEVISMDSLQYCITDTFKNRIQKILQKNGYNVQVIHKYGIECLATKDNKNYLIQSIQSKKDIDSHTIEKASQEFKLAKPILEKEYNKVFEFLLITNAYFTPAAIKIAQETKIDLVDKESLVAMLG